MKRMIACTLALCLLLGFAPAESLFPDLEETGSLFPDLTEPQSVALPSLAAALGRGPDLTEDLGEGGIREVYGGVTNADFNAFGVFLNECGCAMESYETVDRVFTAVVSKDGAAFTFRYDIDAQTAELVYPAGTRPDAGSAPEEAAPQPRTVSVGDTVRFGRFEQDGRPDNGAEPIEWIVLDVREDRALLLSRYGLDSRRFNAGEAYVTWETCTLRAWLNGGFLTGAFTEEEQEAILMTHVDNGRAQGYNGVASGNDTDDRIFLLSYEEAFVQYFTSDRERYCAPTDYADARGAATSRAYRTDGRDTGWWWLRSSNVERYYANDVIYNGFLRSTFVNSDSGMVRPAMWVDLTAAALSD